MNIGDIYNGENPVVIDVEDYTETTRYVLSADNTIRAIIRERTEKCPPTAAELLTVSIPAFVELGGVVAVEISNLGEILLYLRHNGRTRQIGDAAEMTAPLAADTCGPNAVELLDETGSVVWSGGFEAYEQ